VARAYNRIASGKRLSALAACAAAAAFWNPSEFTGLEACGAGDTSPVFAAASCSEQKERLPHNKSASEQAILLQLNLIFEIANSVIDWGQEEWNVRVLWTESELRIQHRING